MIFNLGQNATGKMRGKSLFMKDSADGKYKNIKLVGASVQNGTPTSDNPVDIVSNKVKSITACSKNLFGFEKSAIDVTNELRALANQRLTFTKINDNTIKCNYTGGTYATGFVEFEGLDGTKDYAISFVVKDNTLGYTPRIEKYTSHCTENKLVLSIYSGCGNNEVSSDKYFTLSDIQVEYGTVVTPFKPYEGFNIAGSDETYTLNGINGVYDYIDFERGVRVQRFKSKRILKSDMEKFTMSSSGNYICCYKINDAKQTGNCLCNYFKGIHANDRIILQNIQRCYMESDQRIYFRDNTSNALFTNATASVSFFENNEVYVVYELAEPIETPLTEAELIAFKSLRTYSSGSSLLNDGGCDMEAEYFLANNIGQAMADVHMNTPHYVLDGSTLNIIL